MHTLDFLNAELQHAERHLARIRRIQARMQQDLEQAGLDEVKAYEHLATSKAYRQLQRDESFYKQMWLRISRHLERYRAKAQPQPIAAPAPQPVRKPPTLNQPCPCGSTLKYKRCCGNPHRRQPLAA
jgi:uncharacterized protein YecA (UPF0149 family)